MFTHCHAIEWFFKLCQEQISNEIKKLKKPKENQNELIEIK